MKFSMVKGLCQGILTSLLIPTILVSLRWSQALYSFLINIIGRMPI